MESKNNTTETKGAGSSIRALKAHLALNVRSVDRSIAFYRKMFGIEPSKVRTGYAKFDLQNPPLNFTLNQASFAGHGALSHLGIQVASTEDVLAMRQKWSASGLLTRDEMQTSCCYAVQDKSWVRDPDGNEWEVFVVLQDNLTETAPCECGNKVQEGTVDAVTATSVASGCCAPRPIGVTREASITEAACC